MNAQPAPWFHGKVAIRFFLGTTEQQMTCDRDVARISDESTVSGMGHWSILVYPPHVRFGRDFGNAGSLLMASSQA
jgi:hypothetical protein